MEVQGAMPHSPQYFKQVTAFSFLWTLSKGIYILGLHVKVLSSFLCVCTPVREREYLPI